MSVLRKLMLFWAYFIVLGAVVGAAMFFIDPSGITWGMNPILQILKTELPIFEPLFENFIASGIVLFVVIGLPNLISIILTHKNSRYSIISNAISGWMLIGWILFEFYIWGYELLSVIYMVFGVIQLTTAIITYAQKEKLKTKLKS